MAKLRWRQESHELWQPVFYQGGGEFEVRDDSLCTFSDIIEATNRLYRGWITTLDSEHLPPCEVGVG
jgi:hypothetical protein